MLQNAVSTVWKRSITSTSADRSKTLRSDDGGRGYVDYDDLKNIIAEGLENHKTQLLDEIRGLLTEELPTRSASKRGLCSHVIRSPPLPPEEDECVPPQPTDPTVGKFLTRSVKMPGAREVGAMLQQEMRDEYDQLLGRNVSYHDHPPHPFLALFPSKRDLDDFTRDALFENALGIAILLNALALGLETHFRCASGDESPPQWLSWSESAFAMLFAVEIVFRIYVQEMNFFNIDGYWNAFDLVTVVLQVLEQGCEVLLIYSIGTLIARHVIQFLRPLRILRLMRVVRNFDSLRTIADAIAGSMKALYCTLVVLLLTLYACSIIFTQVVLDALAQGTKHDEELKLWFGDLSRTALTLTESILSGLSWDEAIRPLISDVHPVAGCVFLFFVCFSIIAVLNMVTGVYVEKATQMANDTTTIQLAKRISTLFQSDLEHEDEGEGVSWETFEAKLADEEMKDYFKDINVDPSEARILFKLLDEDESGTVDTNEIVDGLLRLHGNARALDLKVLHYELWRVRGEVQAQQHLLENSFDNINQGLLSLARGANRVVFLDELQSQESQDELCRENTEASVATKYTKYTAWGSDASVADYDDSPYSDAPGSSHSFSFSGGRGRTPTRGSISLTVRAKRNKEHPLKLKTRRGEAKKKTIPAPTTPMGRGPAVGGFWSRA